MAHFDPILLDLDGTLVDAFTTIHRAYVHTLPQFGLPAPTMEQVRRAVGGGLENAMRHFVSEEQLAAALQVHLDYTNQILLEDARLMPGGLELLQRQQERGIRCGVFTNKRGNHARKVCEHLGATPYLAGIFGAKDTPWVKPQPEFAAHVLQQLSARPESTVLIGDSPFDVKAAHAGGFACWCVTTGTHTADQLRAAGAEAIFSDLFAVTAALEEA